MFKSWDNRKKTNAFIIFTISIVILSIALFSQSGIINRIILTRKQEELIEQINYEQKIFDSLTKEINRLKTDTLEIEKIAREKYGMKRPGEKIFLVPPKK